MTNTLITSQTRVKLMLKFFLNGRTKAHLRGLETEFGESSNSIRIELNRFEKAGLLLSLKDGNKKVFQANSDHPLFNDIHSIILKETGIDREYLAHKVQQAEDLVGRKISYVILSPAESTYHLNTIKQSDLLPLWVNGNDNNSEKTSILHSAHTE